ncbi:MAG: BACON domain-containing protein [Duncaniella sp.]|nr:BACON domain-containing protein [Duncaniella sp.]
MNKFLLVAAALSIAATAMGQTAVSGHDLIKERTESGSAVKIVKRANSRVADVITSKGAVAKRICTPLSASKTINPRDVARRPAMHADALDSDILFENFEGWDGETAAWVPEGWTVESKGTPQEDPIHSWFPSAGGPFYPEMTDGKYYYAIIYGEDQDEWIISPVVTTTEGKNLHFNIYFQPYYFYNLDGDHFDFDKFEFTGEREIVCDIKVNIRETGGEWATLLDLADQFKDLSAEELVLYNQDLMLKSFSVDLSAYVGKEFQIAFQYVGSDGESCFIDNIRIGYPILDTPVYMMPYSTQYWGFTRDFIGLNKEVAMLPPFTELTWSSLDYIDDAAYSWKYNGPEYNGQWALSDGDELSLIYTNPSGSENENFGYFFNTPELTISAPGAKSNTYQNPAKEMQIGGSPYIKLYTSDNESFDFNMGMLPFDFIHEDIGVYTYREDFGTPIIPIFGYSPDVDKFWTDYTFHGDDGEDDGVKLTSILNFLYSSPSPMVVTAADLFAYTLEIGQDVEFTCTIVPINDDFEFMTDNPLASASIKGKDIVMLAEGDQSPDLSCLTFEFEKPVVLDDTYQAYVVMISGFNNPDVAYFCPFQSLYPADVPMAYGWVSKDITAAGVTRRSFSPMSDAEGEPLYTSFAINLEASLPWLQCEADEIVISDNGTTVTLDSYYAGEEFAVSAPDWAEATVEGRYRSTTLTVTAEYSETAREGEIEISAPGVSKKFKLSQPAGTGMSGISEITSCGNDAATAVYNLNGQKVNAANLVPGIYMIKRASGKVEKAIVK